MSTDLDFELDGLSPADDHSDYLWGYTWESDHDLLARHDVGERSFFLTFNTAATWDVERNLPNIATFCVQRDRAQGTFAMDSSAHANAAFARKWLADRGCPPEAMELRAPFAPADELTTRIEDKIHRSGERYDLIEVKAADEDPTQAWTTAIDREAAELPVRVFIEQSHPDQGTYTVREGAFPNYAAAENWLDTQSTPLPEYRRNAEALRTHAALARSTAPITASVAAVVASAPAAAAVAQPDRGRSL